MLKEEKKGVVKNCIFDSPATSEVVAVDFDNKKAWIEYHYCMCGVKNSIKNIDFEAGVKLLNKKKEIYYGLT